MVAELLLHGPLQRIGIDHAGNVAILVRERIPVRTRRAGKAKALREFMVGREA